MLQPSDPRTQRLSLLTATFLTCVLSQSLDAGEWIRDRVTNASGTRAFELYVPNGYRAGEKRPLLVGIHGCTQTSADFGGLTRGAQLAEKHELLLLLPAQSALANSSLCWNWFLEGNQKRGQGEPSLIVGMIDCVKRRYDLGDDGVDNDSVSRESATTRSDVSPGGLGYTSSSITLDGTTLIQHVVVNRMGHAWAGGDPHFAYAEPNGPDESGIIWSFLRLHQRGDPSGPKRRAAGH
jgi:poly(3-hydroxybutyrate) depolymerase